jgi:hypothetical protein
MKHRQVFSIGTANAVDRAELSYAIGGVDRSNAVDTGVTVGGVGGVEFVTAPNPSQFLIITNGIVDGECIVPRDPEDVVHADVMQTGKYVLDYACE